MTSALIGDRGTIGKSLSRHMRFDHCYNSTTIVDAANHPVDILYCCAPSGNRLIANKDPKQDLQSVLKLISDIKSINFKKIVMISTVDTQHCPESAYGGNRLYLEQFVKQLPDHHIVRLCTLIDPLINKNILYDLKHQKFLDSINLEQKQHWYFLDHLTKHLEIIVAKQLTEINLISEPISAEEITSKFLPNTTFLRRDPCKSYDLKCEQAEFLGGKNSYIYDKNQILGFMEDYLNDNCL